MQDTDKASRRQHKSKDKEEKPLRSKDISAQKEKKDKKKREKSSSKSKARKSEKKAKSEARREYPVEINRPGGLAIGSKDYNLDVLQPNSGANSKFTTTFQN